LLNEIFSENPPKVISPNVGIPSANRSFWIKNSRGSFKTNKIPQQIKNVHLGIRMSIFSFLLEFLSKPVNQSWLN
jgi:hypothetical protein